MNEIKLRIVTEGINDIHLIRKLLHQELVDGMKFYASQGKVSAVTVARNILVHEGGPLLLVVDADTLDVERQREYEETALAAVDIAYPREYYALQPLFKVFTFRPCIEVVFFEAPKALELLIGKKLSESDIEQGKAIPKKLLPQLMGIKDSLWLDSLTRKIDDAAADLLRDGEQATRLRETVNSLLPMTVS
jgi:hypothetical protein